MQPQVNIRSYELEDFTMLSQWWKESVNVDIREGMMCENGTFILELENMPALSLTVLLTQSKEMAYVEFYVKNPAFKSLNLEAYGKELWDHCFEWAKRQGYKNVLGFVEIDKLRDKYFRFGMKQTLSGLTGLIMEL